MELGAAVEVDGGPTYPRAARRIRNLRAGRSTARDSGPKRSASNRGAARVLLRAALVIARGEARVVARRSLGA
jgi:hypothetical protein